MLVAKGFTQGSFVILWMLIYQLSGCFKRVRVIMFSLCTFPIMVAQICLNSRDLSCLPSLGIHNEAGGGRVAVAAQRGGFVRETILCVIRVSCAGRTGRTHIFLLQARYA